MFNLNFNPFGFCSSFFGYFASPATLAVDPLVSVDVGLSNNASSTLDYCNPGSSTFDSQNCSGPSSSDAFPSIDFTSSSSFDSGSISSWDSDSSFGSGSSKSVAHGSCRKIPTPWRTGPLS